MMKGFKIEQVNPNDNEYQIIKKYFNDGDKVTINQVLFEVEGQKNIIEVLSCAEGWINSPYSNGDYFSIDDHLYFISDKSNSNVEFSENSLSKKNVSNKLINSDLLAKTEVDPKSRTVFLMS